MIDGRARYRNRSGVVELVGREPLMMFARVENGVKFFCRTKKRKQNFRSDTTVFNGEFSFFGRGKPNFWGGGDRG